MICFVAGDVLLFAAIGTSEARQFAAIPIAAASVVGIPILILCNYCLVSRENSGRGRLLLRGLCLPLITLALEALFIFR
jgi:hypothetical protein